MSNSAEKIKTPAIVNLELTELCNVKCKHCYNPWRDESMGENYLDLIKIKRGIKFAIGIFRTKKLFR